MRGEAARIARRRSPLLVLALRTSLGVPPLLLCTAALPVPVPPPGPLASAVQTATAILPTPTVAVATPSVPSVVAVSPPAVGTGTVAPASPAPTTAPAGRPVGSTQRPGSTVAPARSSPAATRGPGLRLPFTAIVISSPVDVALLAAVACLPLLFVIWLFVFGRTFAEARRAREAQVRLMLAGDLGLRPRELGSISTSALFGLREKAAFDELTGVLRRAAGVAAAQRAIASARRHGSPLSVAFLDVDGLKQANDKNGHAAGDRLLKSLAELLRNGLRTQDMVFRYGGDEFVCVLPDTAAGAAREKLSAIQRTAAKAGVRFCLGVAELGRHDDLVSLFGRADKELYDFKARRGEIVPLRLPAPERPRRRTGAGI